MEKTEPAKLHCPDCLQGQHRSCHIYTPREWEGGGLRCVCKCRTRVDTRLTNVERKCARLQGKNPAPRAERALRQFPAAGRPTKWTDDRIRSLVVMKGEGLSSRQIAVRLGDGTHMDTVRTYLSVAKKKGITA